MTHCLALPRVHSSHSLKVPVTWMPRALVVVCLIFSEGLPSSMLGLLTFLLGRVVADTALSSLALQRRSTLVTQPSWVLIWGSRMISPVGVLTTMFCWSLAVLFSCKSLHIRENRFAPALGQNFTSYRVWTHFLAGIMPELPWIDSLMLVTLYRPVSLLVIGHDAPDSLIQIFFVNKKMCHHLWCTSYQPLRAVLHLPQTKCYFFIWPNSFIRILSPSK